MKLRKLTGFLGAEVWDADPTAPVLKDLLAEHLVLVLRGQHLDLPAQKRLTQVFGPLMQLPYVVPMAGEPDVIAVLKEADERQPSVFGGAWHSDFSFLENPPAGSVLNAVEVPKVGGDTAFTSMAAAYRSLPARLRDFVDGRRVVHLGAPYGVKHAPPEEDQVKGAIKMSRGDPTADVERFHPTVITHPATGERALFVNPTYTVRFEDMTVEDSAPILAELYAHATRPDFQCRVRWAAGDVTIWDNRMTLHYATNDYDGVRRLLYRTTFTADPPS